ncbi:MAG: hypothetical protein VYB30_03255 [Candidatus Thermoplasmatota archaeon]|nr:hypothetical protein [Candidatus Thermoplasmatota archaeon]
MVMSNSTSHRKLNMVIAAWTCILLGAGIVFGTGGDTFAIAVGAPLSITGAALLIFGLGMPDESSVDPEKLAAWAPDAVKMPDAGRAMYRVDTSLDPPIKTSILCGRCSHLEWVDGRKPASYDCVGCNTPLWVEEEE